MAVAFKVDEDLPTEVAQNLLGAGHDARTVREQGLGGSADERLWELLQIEKRCLVTADKGFANAQKHPPGTHAGIVLFRLPRESRNGYVRLAKLLLKSEQIELVRGTITVVTPDAIRIHRAG